MARSLAIGCLLLLAHAPDSTWLRALARFTLPVRKAFRPLALQRAKNVDVATESSTLAYGNIGGAWLGPLESLDRVPRRDRVPQTLCLGRFQRAVDAIGREVYCKLDKLCLSLRPTPPPARLNR